ncbi:hypothetical protein ACROYT_G030041 [Oculina patagonica]
MARNVSEVVSMILKDAISRIEDENPRQQPSTSSDTSSQSFSDAVERDLKRAFPSLSGGGNRMQIPTKKGKGKSKGKTFIMIQPKKTWTHDFCLLSNTEQDKTPSQESLLSLKESGLGRKRVVFPNKNGNFEHLKNVLETEYEKLKCQDGAFELMRAESGGTSRPLKLLLMPSDGYTIPYIRDLVGSSTLLYIRPMQSCLFLDKPPQPVTTQSPLTKCPKCSLSIPIMQLRKHCFVCSKIDIDSDSGDEKEFERSVFDKDQPIDCEAEQQNKDEIEPSASKTAVYSGIEEPGCSKASAFTHFPSDSEKIEIESIQIKSDEQFAWSLQEELNRETSGDESNHANYSTINDEVGVLNALEEKVIKDKGSLFLVIRRGAPLERVLHLWRRETRKISPDHEVRIKFVGEDEIDSGALSKEFFTITVEAIAQKFFPNGSPIHSTNDVQNGNFRACGEIVATSLAQGGPPPCFLAESVYDSLVLESNIDFSSISPERHLTSAEQELLQQIQSDVLQHQDTIFEHGYTGVVDEAHLDSITASIVFSMLSRRMLCLNEFKKGLELYGLAGILSKYPEVTQSLFVIGQQKKVDANYLFSLMVPEYSLEGSSHRHTEEQVMDHFQDFLLTLQDERISGYAEAIAWKAEDDLNVLQQDPPDGGKREELISPELTPAGVLGWLTGQKHREVNKSNFSITVMFDHDCLKRNPKHSVCFPSVGACGHTITFPVCHMQSFEKFKEIFLLAFCKGQTFAMR